MRDAANMPKLQHNMATGDVNRDGKADLVATLNANSGVGCQSDTVAVLIGLGTGKFKKAVYYPTGSTAQEEIVYLVDVNGDGKLDIVTGNADGTISVLLNKGNGTYTVYGHDGAGREHHHRYTKEAAAQARQTFEKAVALDPLMGTQRRNFGKSADGGEHIPRFGATGLRIQLHLDDGRIEHRDSAHDGPDIFDDLAPLASPSGEQ